MISVQGHTKTSEDEEAFVYAMQLVSSVAMPMVMKSILDLHVLEIIARSGEGAHLSPVEIASHLPTQNPDAPPMLDRMLRLLANHSVLTCSVVVHDDGDVERRYGLGPVCKYFVPDEDGVSFSPWMSTNQDDACIRVWSSLKDAILEGGNPFTRVHGISVFEYTGRHPEFNQSFSMAMLSHTMIFMKKVLKVYKGIENLKEIVDVGGGIGAACDVIISKYPNIKCINLDLPHVIQSAPPRLGIQHMEGDMFVSVPKGDAILIKYTLHDWDDEHCNKLLKNCYQALADNGMVIVIDMVVPDIVESSLEAKVISQSNVLMLASSAGAKERTRKEFETLAKGAGFNSIKFVCCVCNSWVIEFHKMA